MSDETPKKLDNLFRQGSEQYDFEYNAEAWEGMKTLLDKDVRRRRFFWWWLGGFGMFVLMAGVVLFLGNDQSGSISPDSDFIKTEHTSNNNNKTVSPDLAQKEETYISENKNEATINQKINKTSELNNKIKNNQKSKIKNGNSHFPKEEIKIADEKTKAPSINISTIKNNKKEISVDIKKDQLISQKKPALDTFTIIKKNKIVEKIDLNKIPFLPLATIKYNPINRPLPYLPVIKENTGNGKEEIPKDNSKKDAWIIGLTAAGETTSIGMDDFSELNWKIGGHIEYRFLNKYSANLGANFIRKKYGAGAGKYIPPKGFWANGIAPVSTDARCNILELPLLLSYYPKGYSNSGFFGNIGVTSYLMLRERYTYTYEDPAPDSIIAWGTENENQHWFGVGQLGLGYNQLLSNKTSLQYLPYLQIPLAGVGHGNVKLWSVGMSVKFNFKVQ